MLTAVLAGLLVPVTTSTSAAAAGGTQSWLARYTPPGPDDPATAARAVAVSPDGSRVFVTGASTGYAGVVSYGTLACPA